MFKRNNNKLLLFSLMLILTLTKICNAQETERSLSDFQISDTLILDEVSLGNARFYLTEDLSEVENTIRDTTFLTIEGKVYKLPYRITSTTKIVFGKNQTYFRLTGLSLSQNPNLENYVSELFTNPREYLKDLIPAKEWKNSAVYLRYFEPYDKNSSNRSEITNESETNEENELDQFMADENSGYVIQNYENFPFPETIDIEVDLRESPKTVSILGIEFNFDKLDKGFQKLLLDYGKSGISNNRKSNSELK